MLRERQRVVAKLHTVITAIVICVTYFIWFQLFRPRFEQALPPGEYERAVALFASIVTISLYMRRMSIVRRVRPNTILRELAICFSVGMIGYALATWVFKFSPLSRMFILGGMLAGYVTTALWYFCSHWWFADNESKSGNSHNVLVVGDSETLPAFIASLTKRGLRVAGFVTIDGTVTVPGLEQLGHVHDLSQILNSRPVDCAIFLVYRQSPEAIEKGVLLCRERGIEVWLRPDFMQIETSLWQVDYLEGMPLLVFSLGPQYGWAIVTKRAIDIVGSFILLILSAVPMLIVGIFVRMSSKGAAIFKQERVGLNGRKFVMYKFRTMFTGDRALVNKASLQNEMTGPVFKAKNDPRVTPIGRVLRKYSIDELPQLWNVFLGEMSLVGPRPPLVDEVDLYTGWQRRRLSMRPGLSCIWQVSGRNQIRDFEDWVRADLKYIDGWSLWLDLVILYKTIGAVVKGTGY